MAPAQLQPGIHPGVQRLRLRRVKMQLSAERAELGSQVVELDRE